MGVDLGVVMDPIERINYRKDTSLVLLLEAQRRGWNLWYMHPEDLFSRQERPAASMRPLQVMNAPDCWYEVSEPQTRELADLDVILMRKDPPVTQAYLYACMLLELAERLGTLVVNRPRTLMERNEKLFALHFPKWIPETLVSAEPATLHAFIDEFGDTILKPLDGMGGASIFRVRSDDPNRHVIVETLGGHAGHLVMAQRFLPEIAAGDKRVLMVNGEPLRHGLARIPRSGETRGNLAAGGIGKGFELGDDDLRIAAEVGPVLRAEGILFAGLDIIGDRLTEINITSPTCVQEVNRAFGLQLEADIIDAVEQRLGDH